MQPVTVFLQISLVYVLLNSCSCSWESGNMGVDRPGGNLPNMPVALGVSEPPSACYEMCQKNPQCRAWSYCIIGCCKAQAPACYLKSTVPKQNLSSCAVSGVKNDGLASPKFVRLPIGSVIPEGWMKDQLQLQFNGLSGHLQLFWPDIVNSSWIGGNADVQLHERFPYWLNGLFPLAYQLQNETFIQTVNDYVNYIASHQTVEGWLGPDDDKSGNMYWSKYFMMYVMIQYYEATGDSSILPVMFKFLHAAHKRMFTTPLGKEQTWSGTRWQDLVYAIHWLLDNAPSGEEQFLWDMAELVEQQGYRWKDYFMPQKFPNASVSEMTYLNHGVNLAMAIKSGGVWYRQSRNESDAASSLQRMKIIDKYHGQASGIFSCDEHLAGLDPNRGTELCTVVEAMFSYEVLFAIQGDPVFAEKAEMITYNALPATFTRDMWAHQYLQQANEDYAIHSSERVWKSDGPDATLYGLAPNYGCCTANFNQGWPKMAQSLVMASPDGDTLVVSMYAPVSVKYKGASLTITTDYPFDDTVIATGVCSSPKTVQFRIPSWANGATLTNGNSTATPVANGTLASVPCHGSLNVKLVFPMKIRVERRYKQAASIYHGALLYSLHVGENYTILKNYSFESKDYQVTPLIKFDYAIKLTDDNAPENDLTFSRRPMQTKLPPYSVEGAPSRIIAKGTLIPQLWKMYDYSAADPPVSPIALSDNEEGEELIFLPFGATCLRMAEIPTHE